MAVLSDSLEWQMYGHFELVKEIGFYLVVLVLSLQLFNPFCTVFEMVFRQIGILSHLFRKGVDPNSKRHGGELVAQVLKSHGVEQVFTLSGGHISPILVGAESLGIRIVDTRHEVTTVFAADAVARVSGVPGVAVVTAGPGLTNTITAVKNAQMAESPVILIGGCPATLLKGRGALQDIDHMSVFKSVIGVEIWAETIEINADICTLDHEMAKVSVHRS